MKKTIVLTLLTFLFLTSIGQDVLERYKFSKYHGWGRPVEYQYLNFIWNSDKSNAVPQEFSGEYEIFLREHHWHKEFPSYPKTFTIETVSFPFAPNCDVLIGNCPQSIGGNERNLFMPLYPYSPQDNGWTTFSADLNDMVGITRISPVGKFDNTVHSYFDPTKPYHLSQIRSTLISAKFTENTTSPGTFKDRLLFPHCAHKITVNLHCPSNPGLIISSFSFIQDNTRGQMRFYPFRPTNNTSAEEEHDVVFAPELISKPYHKYNEPGNPDIYDGGTINYYPFSEIVQGCTGINYPLSNDEFIVSNQIFYPFPPPYSLHSSFIREFKGRFFAGYSSTSFQIPLAIMQGIEHKYFIDKNIDLTIINPVEKIIYNPSVCTLTTGASNLIFPSGYRFQTTMDKYPDGKM